MQDATSCLQNYLDGGASTPLKGKRARNQKPHTHTHTKKKKKKSLVAEGAGETNGTWLKFARDSWLGIIRKGACSDNYWWTEACTICHTI